MKIAVSGNYGAKNLGDEMILAGMLESLKNAAPKAEIIVLSANPEETVRLHNIKSVPQFPSGIRSLLSSLFKKSQTKTAVKSANLFILGGGGLFGSLTLRAYFTWGIQAFIALRLNKKLIIYGQSVGPVKGLIKRLIVQYLFSNAAFIALRDKESIKELKKLRIQQEIHLMPDLALRKTIKTGNQERSNQIVFALRKRKKFPKKCKNGIRKFAEHLNETNDLITINFQEGPDSDESLHNEIFQNIKNLRINGPENPGLAIEKFQQSKLIVAMRLHSIITAIKTGTPFIAISYAPKVRNLLKTIGLEDLIIEMHDVSLQNLKNKLKQIQNSEEETKAKLNNIRIKALQDHSALEEKLAATLASNSSKSNS